MRRTIIKLVDDINGGPADETVEFGLDGRSYSIDLSAGNASKFRESLASYVAAGRRTSAGRRHVQSTGSSADAIDPKAVRAWAQSNGYEVSARGRVSGDVVAAYRDAHS